MRFNFLSVARLLAATLITTLMLMAAPVTNDLWDASQPGFAILQATPNPAVLCGVESNLFGTALPGSGCPSGNGEGQNGFVVFRDVASQVWTVEWTTALIQLEGFEFNYGLHELGRTAAAVQLFAWNGASFDSFFTAGNLNLGNGTLAVTLGSAVTSDRWRAQITNSNLTAFNGARVQELDGFGRLASTNGVPEPGTMLVAAAGLLLLASRKSWKP
jgi:hypothetical protein